MSEPAVSVIIPTYNRSAFLKEAVCSVLNQTFRDWELIVYDDGSDDDTRSLMGRFISFYRNMPVYYIRSDENRGPSYARNVSVTRAKGKLIAFLDSDDLWNKNKLKLQFEYMYKERCDICQTDEIWVRNGVRVNAGTRHAKPAGDIFSKCLELCVVSPSAVMLTKDLFLKTGGFDESMPACEDYDLWLRIAHSHPVHLLDKKLVVKRGGHGDQLSKTIPHLDRFRIYSMEKLLRETQLSGEKRDILITVMKNKCKIYGQGLIKHGRVAEGERYEQLPYQYLS